PDTSLTYMLSFYLSPLPPRVPPPFPYTTLFRSGLSEHDRQGPEVYLYHHPLSGHRRGHQHRPVQCGQVRGGRADHHPPHSGQARSEEHTSELQSRFELVCRLLLEKKNNQL